MKVELTPQITNQKIKLSDGVKKVVEKLKPLKNDTFEKQSAEKVEKKIIISRKHPNWCDMPEDGYRNNTIARTRCYYPEDVKKMESMTKEEAIEYSIELDKAGKYYYDDNYHVDTPALDEFFKRHNINIEDYIIKDKP